MPVRLLNDRARQITDAEPLLEPGEVVAHVARAQEGPNKWVALLIALAVGLGVGALIRIPILGFPIVVIVFSRLYARRLLMATDRAVVVLAGGRWRYTPTKVLDRLPVDTRIGPLKGLWMQTTLNGRRLFVAPRSMQEVAAADADIPDD